MYPVVVENYLYRSVGRIVCSCVYYKYLIVVVAYNNSTRGVFVTFNIIFFLLS